MFRVLEKSPENKFTIGKILKFVIIILTVFILLFSLASVFHRFHQYQKDFVTQWIGGFYLFFVLVKVIHYIFFQQKKGKFIGDLIFKDNEIEVLDKIYPLESISKIRIIGNDIKGDFQGFVSQGTKNELIINLLNGNSINYNFEQTSDNRLKDTLVLKKYVDAGKLGQVNYESIIENKNYY